MKFLTKINRQYFWTLSILLMLISIVGYFILKNILIQEIKEDILGKEFAIIKEIKEHNNLPNIYPIIETSRTRKDKAEPKSFTEITLKDEFENEQEPFLQYTNTVKINNRYYLIKLRHSLLENNDLMMAISLPLLILLMLALIISFVITKQMNKTVWNDFEFNLKEIKNFSFNRQKINLKQTDIEEFNSLNKTLLELTEKLNNDYQSLKEFTENASHELQTPIAVISLNLEEILQHDLSESVFKQIVTTQKVVKRLSNLNKNLILLAKINNKQYPVDIPVIVNEIIKEKIKEFTPLLKTKNINITYNSENNFILKMNRELVEILFNNLLSNAIKHNKNNGRIKFDITDNEIKICNTGKPNSLTNSTIFNRFTKENSQSYGLGLSIVKQICTTHNLNIRYTKNNWHCFTITSSIK